MEKIKALLYCTKNGKKLVDTSKYDFDFLNQKMSYLTLNGKIVAECDFEAEHLYNAYSPYRENVIHYFDTDTLNEAELIKRSCLSNLELENYFNNKNGYAIHIKNLKERVMELSDCCIIQNESVNPMDIKEDIKIVKKAPQNMMRVWIYENGKWVMYILISVRPEWLYLELIGEKTIECRKRVLKEML